MSVTPTFASHADLLTQNGYLVVPLDHGKKWPTLADWPNYRYKAEDKGNPEYANAGIGLITGATVAVDNDIRDKVLAAQVNEHIEKTWAAPQRQGLAPKTVHLLKAHASVFGKRTTVKYRLPSDGPTDIDGHKFEILASGQQVVAYGIHPDTKKPYSWIKNGDPQTVPWSALPSITDGQAFDLITRVEKMIVDAGGTPLGRLQQQLNDRPRVSNDEIAAKNPALLREALSYIDNKEGSYDDWICIGLAIKGALGQDGRADFLAFSAQHSKNDPRESERKWDSFWKRKKPDNKSIGAGTIFYLARQAGWSPTANSIELRPGKIHESVAESIVALASRATELKLFQRSEFLVQPTTAEGYGFKAPNGERPTTQSLRLKKLSPVNIRLVLSAATTFSKAARKKKDADKEPDKKPDKKPDRVIVDCPREVAQSVFESSGSWHGIPVLDSISETPAFDGRTLYCGPGLRNGVYVLAPKIELPAHLTKDDAIAALNRVKGWCDEFSYSDDRLDSSALLSFFLTAALRFSIDVAPGFAITKHSFGAGATTATKMGAVIATGREPSVMPCSDEAELEKQLTASLIHGENIRILDNLKDGSQLSSRLLAQSLSEPLVKVRIFGKTDEVVCPTAALVAVTGVNIQTAQDLNRRFIRISLDPKMSAPETRAFKRKDVVAMLARERNKVLRDLFTITAAYIASGEKVASGELSGFHHWVQWVVQPLMWLGEENVLRTVRAAAISDPTVAMLRRVIPLLGELIQLSGKRGGGLLVSEMINEASHEIDEEGSSRSPTEEEKRAAEVRRTLRDALGEATSAKRFANEWQFDARLVGEWFSRHHGRFVTDGKCDRRIAKGRMKGGSQMWVVEQLGAGPDGSIES
jgi:putative DNA primase/helicase